MGAGSHGGFGKTKGAQHSNAPISSLREVRYSKKKTEGYLLNSEHPIGYAKAKYMKDVLGYSKSDSKLFHKNVVTAIVGKIPTKSTETQFGIKHNYNNVQIIGKAGKTVSANVVVVIQKDNGRVTYKIVTVYPDKKGE